MNPYAVLGVDKTATDDEIRRAYRQTARKHHPDRNPGDAQAAARFNEAGAAYQALSDPETRAYYDAHGRLPDQEEEEQPRRRTWEERARRAEKAARHWRARAEAAEAELESLQAEGEVLFEQIGSDGLGRVW